MCRRRHSTHTMKRCIKLLSLAAGMAWLLGAVRRPAQFGGCAGAWRRRSSASARIGGELPARRSNHHASEVGLLSRTRGAITGAQADISSRLGAGALQRSPAVQSLWIGPCAVAAITDSGRTPNAGSNAKLEARAGRENYRATRYDVVLGVDQAYYEVLLAQQLVRVSQQTVAARQTVVDQVRS